MQISGHVNKSKTVSEPDRTEHNKRQRRKAIRMCKKQAPRRLRRAFNFNFDESWRALRIAYCDGDHYGSHWTDHYYNGDYDKPKPRNHKEYVKLRGRQR